MKIYRGILFKDTQFLILLQQIFLQWIFSCLPRCLRCTPIVLINLQISEQILCKNQKNHYLIFYINMLDALRSLVPFGKFKKPEKNP